MLTGKQKRYLRKKSHHLKPIFQIGKSGVHGVFLKEIQDVLEARELIKISVLQNSMESADDAGVMMAKELGAELVQVLGSTITLYKPSENNKQIELPR